MKKANNPNIGIADVDKLDTTTANLEKAEKAETNTVNEPSISIIDSAKVE